MDNRNRKLRRFITGWMSDERVPGLSLSLVEEGECAFAEGFGSRDLRNNQPATPDTLYAVASVTKSFTALALMQLTDQSLISPDDPVAAYVSWLDTVEGEDVTIHQLLSHTSGMPSDGTSIVLIGRSMAGTAPEIPMSREKDHRLHVRASADQRVSDQGDRYFYYNSGYNILARVIEEVTGQSFPQYLREQILEPLGMRRSTFSVDRFREDDDRMTPYAMKDGRREEVELPTKGFLDGAGGLVSSVRELVPYLKMYLNQGKTENGEQLVAPDRLREMCEPRITRDRGIDGSKSQYGYGLVIEEFLGQRLIGHSGSLAVSTSYLGFQPEEGLGVAVACNTGHSYSLSAIGKAALAIWQGRAPEEVVPYFSMKEKFTSVEGTYTSYRDLVTAHVERNGGTLEVQTENALEESTYQLHPSTQSRNDRTFYTVTETGKRREARFEEEEGTMVLYFDRWRLERE